jgi:hypothetical protein
MATIRSAPGYSRLIAFSSNLGKLDDEILAYEAPIVSDDEYGANQPEYGVQQT